MSTPTGPAGGDLGGTYPNPTVPGLVTLQAAIDALQAEIDSLQNDLGVLSGTVATNTAAIAANTTDITTLASSLVTVENDLGSLETTVAAIRPTYSGAVILDGSGTAPISVPTVPNGIVATWRGSAGAGDLFVLSITDNDYQIVSGAGSFDAGQAVYWLAS